MRKWLLLLVMLVLLLTACEGDFDDEEDFFEEEPVSGELSDAGDEELLEVEADDGSGSADYLADYAAYIEEIVERDNIAGVAIAVIEGDEIVLVQGFGYRDLENGLPVTADTLFHIGSTNKSFTAMLVATLVDEGLITWDTPIVDVYPDFPLSDEITFRHLLSMRSGIADEAEDDFDVDNSTAEDVLDFLNDIDLFAEPGEEFSYSNISSATAGYAAVLAADADNNGLYDGYIDLLQQRILDPIGMETAVARVSEAEQNPNYGKSYVLGSDGQPEEAEPEDYDGDPLAPSGTLKASAAEMALYISTYLNQGVAPNGTRVVSAENMAVMVEPYLEDYALGWENKSYEDIQVISHEGSFDNYLSIIGFSPDEELGFVILANTADAAETLIEEAPQMLFDLYWGE
ncbi:MAG: beta-lactamase family protein [Anaerolineales bacterium]|nr:beta-lactamase family protein [Anaerolineales bacterium]